MAASQTYALTDTDMTVLAQQFNKDDLGKLGERLGFTKAFVKLIAAECGDGAILRILTTWRNSNPECSNVPSYLVEKLREEFPEQAEFLKMEHSTKFHPVYTNLIETKIEETGVDEELLAHLAENIRTEELAEDLARNLGFKQAAIQRYMATNRMEGRVTYRGTMDMLYDWRDKENPRDQQAILKKALVDSGMARLVDLLPESSVTPEEVYSLPITDNLTVHGCRKKLMDRYKKSTCKIQLRPWDKEHTTDVQGIYTIVTMVKRDREGNELKRVVLKGSVHDIFSANVDGMKPDRILLLAPAGKGKTTAVAKLAYDWIMDMQGSPLQDLPLLFVLKLRNVNQMMSLGEAITSQLLDDVEGLNPESIEEFIEKNQEICHIIMDGIDEYAGTIKEGEEEPSNSLVRALQNKSLRNCRILVTARPHLEQDFDQGDLSLVYAKMEIEGFAPENVTTYIDKFFSNNYRKGNSLKAYLHNNEVIKELTLIPFFTMMVCHLWSENLLDGITTQTALFDSVNTFFRHHLQKKGRELSDDLFQRTIVGLGKVALSGLLTDKNKLVFTPDDFKDVHEAYETGIELGVISSTTTTLKHVTAGGPTTTTTVEFYHKLAQEHAAGKYLATKEKWHMKLKTALDISLKKIQTSLADYENLLRFAAGTKDSVCVKVLRTILGASTVSNKEKYRILLDCSSESTDLSGGTLDLVQRCIGDGAMILQAPTVYTAVGLKKLPDTSKQQINRLHISTPKMEMAVAYKLASSIGDLLNLSELLVEETTGKMMTLRDGCLMMKSASKEMLRVFAGLNDAVLQKIWGVHITGINFCGEETNMMPSFTMKCSNVNELKINVDEGGNICALMNELHPDLLSQVKTLRICLHSIPRGAWYDVALALGYCKSLDQFNIVIAKGSDHEAAARTYGLGTGEWVLTNPSDELLYILSGLHENTVARIWKIQTSTRTLPLNLADKMASFFGICANLIDVDICIDELNGESTGLTLREGILRISPLIETFQTVVAGFHERTLKRVTDLRVHVPRMTARTIEDLECSIGRCVNITKLFVDADGDDVHAIMRRLHPDTLSNVMKLNITMEQRSADGIENLASLLGRCSRINELDISSSTFTGKETLLTLKDYVLIVQSPTNVHCILSNLHPDVLYTVLGMKISAGELSSSTISNLSCSVGKCHRLTELNVYSPADKGFQRAILKISSSSVSWNPVSKELLPIVVGLPQTLLDKILQIDVGSSYLPSDLAHQLAKTMRMFPSVINLSVTVTENKCSEKEMLRVLPHSIKLDSVSGQLLPFLAALNHSSRKEIQHVDLLVPQLTDDIAYHTASVLEAFVNVYTMSLVVAKGTADEAVLLLKHGNEAVTSLSPAVLSLLERLDKGILGRIKSLEFSDGQMTEAVESRLTNLTEMSENLQAVTLNSCTVSDAGLVLTALHEDIVGKIRKLQIRCNNSSTSFDDKLGSAIGRFPNLDEFGLVSTEDEQPYDVIQVMHGQLAVKGPACQAVTMAVSLHQESLDKVRGVHISAYSPEESSTDLLASCLGTCSNIKQLAIDVKSSDDVKGFIRRVDQNTLSKIEHLQVQSPDSPTELMMQLSSIDMLCPNRCSILVAQRNEKRQDHGPPADLPMVYLQGDMRLTIRLCSEVGEVVLVQKGSTDILTLLEEVELHTLKEVQLIMVSAPYLALSRVAHTLASFIGQCASISSLFIRFGKGTHGEASVSIDRHYLRLKNVSSGMFPILSGLHKSIKDEISTLEISESTFEPEGSHRWPFITSFDNLSTVNIEKSFLNLRGLSPSFFSLLERCRNRTSMQQINIWQCGTVGLDRLESYVKSHSKTRFGIAVNVRNVSPRYTFHRFLPYA